MSELIGELRKTTGYQFLMGLLGFIAIIGPGFLTIYRFHPQMLKDLDFGKLVLFSSSLGAPVLFVITFGVVIASHPKNRPTKEGALISGTMGTAISMYVALLCGYFWDLSFRQYLGVLAVLIVAIVAADRYREAPARDSDDGKQT